VQDCNYTQQNGNLIKPAFPRPWNQTKQTQVWTLSSWISSHTANCIQRIMWSKRLPTYNTAKPTKQFPQNQSTPHPILSFPKQVVYDAPKNTRPTKSFSCEVVFHEWEEDNTIECKNNEQWHVKTVILHTRNHSKSWAIFVLLCSVCLYHSNSTHLSVAEGGIRHWSTRRQLIQDDTKGPVNNNKLYQN